MSKFWNDYSSSILLLLLLFGIVANSNDVRLTVIALGVIEIMQQLKESH